MIRYEDKKELNYEDVSKVFEHSGIRRPFQDLERIKSFEKKIGENIRGNH